jgi:hypothetical protein
LFYIAGPKSSRKNKKHVFISYSWSEKDLVYKLKDRLKVRNKIPRITTGLFGGFFFLNFYLVLKKGQMIV